MQYKDYKLTVRVDKSVLEKLGEIVRRENISQSEAVRKSIEYFYFYLLINKKVDELNKKVDELSEKFGEIETRIEESKDFLKEGIQIAIKQVQETKGRIKEVEGRIGRDLEDLLGVIERYIFYPIMGIIVFVFLNLLGIFYLIKLIRG